MEEVTVIRTRELNLCVSCEICRATCPEDAITMEYKHGQFLPNVDDNKCAKCNICLQVCPGIDVDPLKLRNIEFSSSMFDKFDQESYVAYSKNPEIRKKSASGGIITTLVTELIKNNDFDAAFVLPFDNFTGNPVRLELTDDINQIQNAARSKYIPVSVFNVIKTLKKKDNKKYIIVGTPCQLYGIKKFLKIFKILDINLLFLGLFCEKILNFNVIKYFEDVYKEKNEKLVRFEFKTKEKSGWPGNTKLYFDSGREIIVDRNVRISLKPFFQLNRCLFCLDKFNRVTDISFGDCYIPGEEDSEGISNLILRTKKGKKFFNKYSYLFNIKKVNKKEILKSQAPECIKENWDFLKILVKENNIYNNETPRYEIQTQSIKKLSQLQKYIRWGIGYKKYKIKTYFLFTKLFYKFKSLLKLYCMYIFLTLIGIFTYIFSKKKTVSEKKAFKNIILVGAASFNKGAQAMIFTVVDQMRKKFPKVNIHLFSSPDFENSSIDRNLYRFEILPWDIYNVFYLLGFSDKIINRHSKFPEMSQRIKQIVRNSDCIIDISGYILSSQWGSEPSFYYLMDLIIAKKYSIPYYILPQSIGPFEYPFKFKLFLYPLLKLYLKYPEKIFVRERDSLQHAYKFTRDNVEKSYDIVLQNSEYDFKNIFKKKVKFFRMKIKPNSVCVIPNLRVVERTDKDKLYSIYKILIDKILDSGKNIYILRHSAEDLKACKKIKSYFDNERRVTLIPMELNAIELENILLQFDFIIASRYHSIIHAYKNGVPAIVIGWAEKYHELLENFGQLSYFFDAREKLNEKKILESLEKMLKNQRKERTGIKYEVNIIKKNNIFNVFK